MSTPPPRRIAILDGASFVLPYDLQRIRAITAAGDRVVFFGSETRYNAEHLQALRTLPAVEVHTRPVSSSVAPRWRGVAAYLALLADLLRQRKRIDVVDLQFSILWPLELPVLWLLRRRLVFTLHNAVPHGHAGHQHAPTRWIAGLARRLVFVSTATHDDFLQRYGKGMAHKCIVQPHGLLPVEPLGEPVRYDRAALRQPPEAAVFWGNVLPYKGVDFFQSLTADPGWKATGLGLEVHGVWAASLRPLRDELRASGVLVDDRFLNATNLLTLMQRPVVFVLPYHAASQSGVLYTLLAQGCVFCCTDVGDLGSFMRRHGLTALLLRDRSAGALRDCLNRMAADRASILAAFHRAQDACRWTGEPPL